MALVVGARIGLITYTLGTDPRPGRTQHNEERELLESRLVIGDQGTSALRPTAGKGKALYWNTDRTVLQWDTGTGWEDVSTVGGGGVPLNIVVAGTATEGVNGRGARADHVHNLPLATASAHGGMSATDKAKLDNAVVTATANRLMLRDANGRSQVATPAAAGDIATKGYVDTAVGGSAAPVVTLENNGLATPTMLAATNLVGTAAATPDPNQLALRDVNGRAQFAAPSVAADASTKGYVDNAISTHTHEAAHITTGTLAAARLPIVTTSANGAMSAADKTKLDGATASPTNSTLAMRDANGRIQVGAPAVSADAANKGYVDTGLSGKANTTHSHAAADITTGVMSVSRLPYANTTTATDGIITATQLSLITSHSHDASAINTGTISTARLPVASSSSSGIISSTTYSAIYNHNHDGSAITSGTISGYRLGLATSAAPGAMSATDKAKLDSATSLVNTSALVARDANGRAAFASPSASADAATKGYVDGKTWDGSRITTGIIPSGRIWGSTHAYNTQWNGLSSNPARDVWVTAGGELCFNNSARRFKTNIRPWDKDPRDLLGPEPAIYNRLDPATGVVGVEEVGVVAEQAGETVPEFVEWGPDTTEGNEWRIQGWNYKQWTAAHQLLLRWLTERVDRQDRRLDRIEAELGLPPLDGEA